MSIWNRIRQTLEPNRRNRDIDDELAAHIEMRSEDFERAGLTPAAARREAGRKFGSRARAVEETREAHVLAWLDSWRRDSAYSIRGLLRRPAFLLTGLATLALGIGVNVAIFSVLDAMLLKPLPVPDADRLMAFVETRNGEPTGGNPVRMGDYVEGMKSLAATGGFYSETVVIRTAEGSQPLRTLRMAGNVIGAFGYRPVIGRLPVAGDRNVAVLGHRFWERQFGGSRDVLGKTLNTQGGAIEIIGVLGPDASLIEEYDTWVPIAAETEGNRTPRTAGFLMVIARLKAGVPLSQANAELATVSAAMRAANPEADKGLSARLEPMGNVFVNEAGKFVYLLACVVFTVLLIACANIAGLLLARNAERTREAAIRAAVGASRWDLVRLYLFESFWLAVPGGLLGLLAGAWSLGILKSYVPADLPLLSSITIDGRAALFACYLTLFCAVAIGLLPAWQAARLKTRPSPLRSVLVVAQVGVSLVLLITAAILVKSLVEAKRRPLGFQQDHVLALEFEFPWDGESEKLKQFYRQVERSVRELPGVRAAGVVDRLPLQGGSQGRSYLRIRGRNLEETVARQSYGFRAITNGYFSALRIPIVRGRLPDEKRRETLLNESFAKRYFGGADPVGEQVSFADSNREPVWYTVTGIVADVAISAVDNRAIGEVFVPFERTFWPSAALVVHLEGDPGPVIAAAKHVDPYANVRYAGPLETRLASVWSEPNLIASLLTGLAVTALALVCIGIYGMLAGFVRSKTREFGVRLAVGATPGSLMQLSLGHGLKLTVIGLGLGLLSAYALLPLLSQFILGGQTVNPLMIGVACACMIAAAIGACYGPARRAARLDPVIVLRHD
ncbi:MAG: ADOP family duplicated permease [Bryobacteraceae bacterium]